MLDLAKFDEKIHLYLGVQSEVAALRHTRDVGFVRVNAQPMKQAISTWVTKWVYLFAQSLQDHVSTSLERMYSFISYTQKGLETPLSVGHGLCLRPIDGTYLDLSSSVFREQEGVAAPRCSRPVWRNNCTASNEEAYPPLFCVSFLCRECTVLANTNVYPALVVGTPTRLFSRRPRAVTSDRRCSHLG